MLSNNTCSSDIDFNVLLNLASSDKQKRIKRFKFIRDAQNCLFADVLVRMIIYNTTGISNKQLQFCMNKYGKPFLDNETSIHFNISHAGNYVVCAFDDRPIGIDIELMKPIDKKIAERYYTKDEIAYIQENEDFNIERFYKVWTKKESRIKYEGKGLSIPLSSFNVFDTVELERTSYFKIFQNEEAICHICTEKRYSPDVIKVDVNDLLYFAKSKCCV